jgi:cyanophycinase
MSHWRLFPSSVCNPSSARSFSFRPFGRCFAVILLLLWRGAAAPAGEPQAAPAPGIPGALVIVGGGDLPNNVRDQFFELAGGKQARIVVIPTANEKADFPELLRSYTTWKALGAASVAVLHTRDPKRANDPEFIKPLLEATAVWFAGGDQSRLMAAYQGTAVEKELRKLLARGGVVGGTSAGAAVMSQVMITGGNPLAQVGNGFGFLPGAVVDQHFMNRNRLGRLLGVIAKCPGYFGIGIDEQTAVVVKGRTLTVVGNQRVHVCLPPPEGKKPDVQVLKGGDRADLVTLTRTAAERSRTASRSDAVQAPGNGVLSNGPEAPSQAPGRMK